jgi:hypothetical protein
MSRASVEKRTIYFPILNDGNIEACAIPGPDAENCAVACEIDATYRANELVLADVSVAKFKILIPQKHHTQGPVRAIGIAPDSLIHTCDVSILGKGGEMDRQRCSPGNPVLVSSDAEADFALIAILSSIPPLTDNGSAKDATGIDASVIGQIDEANVFGYPLRLEIWRGDIPPMRVHTRAAMVAEGCGEIVFEDNDWANTSARTFYLCTDGRKSMSIQIEATQGQCSIECFAREAHKTPGGSADVDHGSRVQMVLDDAGSTSLSMDAAGSADPISRSIQFSGSAPTLLEIKVTGEYTPEAPAVGTNRFSFKFRADD